MVRIDKKVEKIWDAELKRRKVSKGLTKLNVFLWSFISGMCLMSNSWILNLNLKNSALITGSLTALAITTALLSWKYFEEL